MKAEERNYRHALEQHNITNMLLIFEHFKNQIDFKNHKIVFYINYMVACLCFFTIKHKEVKKTNMNNILM